MTPSGGDPDAETPRPPRPSCPSCGAPAAAGERFCEACGAELPAAAAAAAEVPPNPAAAAAPGGQESPADAFGSAVVEHLDASTGAGPGDARPPTSCPECGASFAADGYCSQCGAARPNPRDHFTEQPAGWLAATCDRGIRHHRNEDAVALAVEARRAVLVVCDGVSNSTDSDVASLAAAHAARDVLRVPKGHGVGTEPARAAAIAGQIAQAADRANDAVLASTPDGIANPPSCTYVAAVLDDDLLVCGQVGDSRGYWLPDAGKARQLGVDDSWAQAMIADGMPRAQAETAKQAHAITRWLGIDSPGHEPTSEWLRLAEPGWVLLCSDGLWNYCSEAADLARLVATTIDQHGTDPLRLSGLLVDWANERGGQDNITVAMARFDPADETRGR